jgi:putative nucleotidyltransferase with HDIG domain
MRSLRSRLFRRRSLRTARLERASIASRLPGVRDLLVACLLVTLVTVVGAVIAWNGQKHQAYRLDQVLSEPVVARVDFEAVDRAQTRKNQEDARNREPSVYQPNGPHLDLLRDRLLALGRLGVDPALESVEQVPAATVQALGLGRLTPEGWSALRKFLAAPMAPRWEQVVDPFIDSVQTLAILTTRDANRERDPNERAFKIVLKHPRRGEITRFDHEIIGVGDGPRAMESLSERLSDLLTSLPAGPARSAVVGVVLWELQPIYLLDAEETDRRRVAARDAVRPVTVVRKANEVLVPAGQELDQSHLELLAAERRAHLDQSGFALATLMRVGVTGSVLLIAAGLWLYFLSYYPRVVSNPVRGLVIALLMLTCQGMSALAVQLLPQQAFAAAAAPTLLTAIVLAIAYDRRFALSVGAIQMLLVMLTLRLPIGFVFVCLTGMAVSLAQLHEVRTRSKLVMVGLWSGLSMAVATVLTGLGSRSLLLPGEVTRIVSEAGATFVMGLALGMVIQGLLPASEHVFKVTTSLTLAELSDASHPLLRRLAQEAPGTFQHSLRLGELAQAAAEAIGANALLCKVGALYHDVGKMSKPDYFIENQAGGPNRHDKLSPAMSHLVIVGHVKDGLELAREYDLPRDLRQFIESHHGTTLVEYFYHAAKQRSEAQQEPGPQEFEFRYPGPKPQTREAAILMLGDSVESAARALGQPNPGRIEHLVHGIANKRLNDGQFDECNLTLQELRKIERAMVRVLCAMHHTRVPYPVAAQDADAPASPPPAAAS